MSKYKQLSFTASIPQWTPSGTSTISVCDDGTISSAWASICGTSNPFNVVSNTSAVSAAAVTPVVVTPTYLTLLMVQGKQYTDPNTVLTGSGPSRISWNMVSGSLPPGITAYPNNSTFELLGTPTQVGTYNFVLNVLGYTNVIDVYPSSSVSVSVSVTIDPAATSMNSAASSNLGSAFVSIDQLLRLLDALK